MTPLDSVDRPVPALGTVFRPNCVRQLTSPDRLDLAAVVAPPATWILLAAAVATLMVAVIGSIVIAVPIKVRAAGILAGGAGLREISTTVGGQVKQLLVHLGERVEPGQTVATIEQPDLRRDLQLAESALVDARSKRREITNFQSRVRTVQDAQRAEQRQNLSATAQFAQQRLTWLQEKLAGQEELAAKGFTTKENVLQIKIEIGSVQDELARTRDAIKQLDVDSDHQRTDQERERLDLTISEATAERQVAALQERLDQAVTVTSAYRGVIAEIKVNEGEVIDRGLPLMSVMPDEAESGSNRTDAGNARRTPLVATLFANPSDGKKVRRGMRVEIVPSTTKREEFGFIHGKVLAVSEVPATQEGMQRVLKNKQLVTSLSTNGAPYEVSVELEVSDQTKSGYRWSSSKGPDIILTGETPCNADIVTEDETLLEVVVPPVKRLLAMIR